VVATAGGPDCAVCQYHSGCPHLPDERNRRTVDSKITLKSYFDNAQGLRNGAPVRLQGVDVGNVTGVRVVRSKPRTPVEITMRVSTKYGFNIRQDSITSLSTAGVLGETFIDIDSSQAKGPEARDGDTLPTAIRPTFRTWSGPARAPCKTWTLCSSARSHPRVRRKRPGFDRQN